MSLTLPILAQPPAQPPARPPAERPDGDYLLAPFLAQVAPAHRELVGMLPVVDVNAAALAGLRAVSPASPSCRRAVAGLMLVDPFLRLRDATLALAEAGVSGVANYPTVQLIDGETARVFDSAGAGVAREIAVLTAFSEAGFETVAFAASLDTARAMLRHGPSRLVLHPGLALADWRERAAASLAVAHMIPALRDQCDTQLLVYRPHGFGPELDQAEALADGRVWVAD